MYMRKALFATVISALAFPAIANTPEWADSVVAPGEVVVTGSNLDVDRKLLPYTVSVVGRRKLESTGSTQVLSAISGMVPGLFVSERSVFGFGVSNGGAGHIKLRRVGGDRASAVLMMVDGQPQFAGIYSHHVADFYGKEQVERVEVLRGPGSVLYGSNAMAGAINIITRKPEEQGVHTALTSQYGSYNTWLSSLSNSCRFGRFSSFVSASYGRTDGTVRGFDFSQADGYAKVGYDFSDQWKASADLTLMKFIGDDPIYPKLSNPESSDVYHQDIVRGETSVTVSNRYASTSGVARVYYSYGNHFVDDPRHFHSKDNRFGVLLYQNFTPWTGAALTVGFDFDRYTGEIPVSGGTVHTPGSLSTMERKAISEYSPYLTLSQQLISSLLTVNGGLRMANSDMFHTRWVPQAGVSVNPGANLTLKGNLAMGYRNPSFRELYLYRMANPDLNPERMWNYEVSVAWHPSRYFSGDMTLYFSRGSNLIQTIDNKNQNTGKFINKGVELSARSHPLDNLWINATYSYLHTSLDNLTGAPKHQYYIGADMQVTPKLSVALALKGTSGLFVSEGMARQNYALLDSKVTYKVWRYLDIFVRLENITDASYTINRGYPMPGFTAFGGFSLKI